MKKGWNCEYIVYKKRQLEERVAKINEVSKRKELEEEIELCDYLLMMLLFSNGETIYDELTMEDFIEDMYEQDFVYTIPSNKLDRIKQITLSLLNLPRLNVEQYKTHIDSKESIEIVGNFLKDKFSDRYYQLYKKTIESNYVLFDKGATLPWVACIDGKPFLRIAKTDDIKMLSALGHEFGHVYRILNNSNKKIENSYCEIESFFCEFNLLLWLIKNNIYSKEAISQFLYLFDTMEQILLMRNFIIEYKLNKINNPIKYREVLNKLQLKKQLNIKSDQDFFDIYSTAIDIDLLTYFNSFMGAINNIDDFDKYEQVIRNIQTGNEDDIGVKVLNKNKGEYDSYLQYRNFLQSQK
ncbi:MAG: hypothetical protein HFI86_02970 [Bacilli bacterium]|nr:hypothetical protein [Bacilli bacterium]